MRKVLGLGISVAAVIATGLTPTAGWAAVTSTTALSGPAAVTANSPPGGDPDTTLTFAVTSGLLTLTAPGTVNLGTATPDTTLTGNLGLVTVTDDRALLAATWTVTASSTAFTTGTSTPAETIPATNADYDPGLVGTTGTITATGTSVTLSGTPQTVVAGTAGTGNNTAHWNPVIGIDIPSAAVGGAYTGTLTQSVA